MKRFDIRYWILLGCVATAISAVGCFGEDEKPRPSFMSDTEPAPTSDKASELQARTQTGAPAGHEDASTPPGRSDRREAPTSESTPPQSDGPLIVVVGDEQTTTEPTFDTRGTGGPGIEEDRRLADLSSDTEEEEEEDDREDEEEPIALLNGIAVRVPRPLPTDDLPAVATEAPAANEPTSAQVASAVRPWKPKAQSEIDILQQRERDADEAFKQRGPMPPYFDTPVPPNNNTEP